MRRYTKVYEGIRRYTKVYESSPAPLWGHQAAKELAVYCSPVHGLAVDCSAGYCDLSTDWWCSVYCTCVLLAVMRDPPGPKATIYIPPGMDHAARATPGTIDSIDRYRKP